MKNYFTLMKIKTPSIFFLLSNAGVAQLAERHLPKVNVVSSNLITRYWLKKYLDIGKYSEFAGVAQR